MGARDDRLRAGPLRRVPRRVLAAGRGPAEAGGRVGAAGPVRVPPRLVRRRARAPRPGRRAGPAGAGGAGPRRAVPPVAAAHATGRVRPRHRAAARDPPVPAAVARARPGVRPRPAAATAPAGVHTRGGPRARPPGRGGVLRAPRAPPRAGLAAVRGAGAEASPRALPALRPRPGAGPAGLGRGARPVPQGDRALPGRRAGPGRARVRAPGPRPRGRGGRARGGGGAARARPLRDPPGARSRARRHGPTSSGASGSWRRPRPCSRGYRRSSSRSRGRTRRPAARRRPTARARRSSRSRRHAGARRRRGRRNRRL